MISTRPVLAFAISVLSRFMTNPGDVHWLGVKFVIAYFAGTLDVGLNYFTQANKILIC